MSSSSNDDTDELRTMVARIQTLAQHIARSNATSDGVVILTFCNWSFRDLTANLLATLARVNRVRASCIQTLTVTELTQQHTHTLRAAFESAVGRA